MSWPLRRVVVRGPSMAPALRHGDVVLAWLPRRGAGARLARPGRAVLLEAPDRPLSVKRVVRRDGGGVWVEGDNADGSTDSRTYGALAPDRVVGVVLLRLWPRPGYVPPSPGGGPE